MFVRLANKCIVINSKTDIHYLTSCYLIPSESCSVYWMHRCDIR